MTSKIVFDLDGTLITCENKHKYVLFAVLNASEGMTTEKLDDWWKLKRNGFTTQKALIELGFSNAKAIADQWIQEIEKSVWGFLDRPFQDSGPTLEYLKTEHNTRITILTGRKCRYQVSQALYTYGFDEYIDDLIVVNPLRILEEKSDHLSKIKPFAYIGDSEIDYLSATRTGVRFVALTRGQRSRNFLDKTGNMQTEDDLRFLNNINSINLLLKGR